MNLYIEGCDGTGKSTIARELAEFLDLNYLNLCNKSEKTIYEFDCIGYLENFVHERTFLSKFVYQSIGYDYNTGWKLSEDNLEFFINLYNDTGVFVILTGDTDILRDRIKVRADEPPVIINKLNDINELYKSIAFDYNLFMVDTTRCSVDEAIKQIANYYLSVLNKRGE